MAALARKLDVVLAEIAGRQHGAVSREQLLVLGFTRHTIQRRIDSGALIPIHPGVYLVGHLGGSPLAMEAAAILACGPHALLSHLSAARIWKLPVPPGGPIEVTVVGRDRRPPAGVRTHSIGSIDVTERSRRHGLPVTSPSLTLLDLARALDGRRLGAALNEARVLRLVSDGSLSAALEAHPNRPGAGALRRLLEGERGPRITRSEAERKALRTMRAHGLEPDASDVQIGPWRVDFLFRAECLAVEVDGYRYHATPRRFVEDRRRVAGLAAKGIQVHPLTWHDLGSGQELAMQRLRETLVQRRTFLGRLSAPVPRIAARLRKAGW